MITVSNKPFDASALIEQYPQGSVERLVLQAKAESREDYRYGSEEELWFELLLRSNIVRSAMDLDKSKFSFAGFYDSKANDELWGKTDNGGFMLKDGTKPSDGIKDIYRQGEKYATECATAMMIVYYKALLDTFGADRFDELFYNIYLMNWVIREPMLSDVGVPVEAVDMLAGDRGYFQNPDYDPAAPEWQGENVIILPDGQYYGHGIGVLTAEKMIDSLNQNRRQDAQRSAYLLEKVSRPDYKRLFRAYQGI